MRVELSTEVLFAQNSAGLSPDAGKTIDVALEVLDGQDGSSRGVGLEVAIGSRRVWGV